MISNDKYETLKQLTVKCECSEVILKCLKRKYADSVKSNRALDNVRTLNDLVILLEKRCIIHQNDIEPIKTILSALNQLHILELVENITRIEEISIRSPEYIPSLTEKSEYMRRVYKIISEEIGVHWKQLARELDIREGTIDKYETLPYLSDKIYAVFTFHASNCDKRKLVSDVLNALHNIRRKDLVKKVQTILDLCRSDGKYRVYKLLCEEIGDYWQEMARALKVREFDIDSIDRDFQNNFQKTEEILNIYQTHCDKRLLKSGLMSALTKINRQDLRVKAQNIYDVHNSYMSD